MKSAIKNTKSKHKQNVNFQNRNIKINIFNKQFHNVFIGWLCKFIYK